jgi:general stress protein CsbA
MLFRRPQMFKKPIRAVALACALVTAVTFTGCADTSWAVKVDNVTVPAGVYISYLYINREKVISQSESSSSSATSSATSSGSLSVGSSSSKTSSTTSSDPWSQKIENKNAATWAMTDALKSSKELAMAEELCEKKKITLSSSETSGISSYAKQYLTYYTGFASNGVKQASLERVLTYSYLRIPKLVQAYYGKSGETPVSDSDLLSYYSSNFADIKQIYMQTVDDNGKALADDKLKSIEATINSIYAQLTADKSKFDALQTQYDEDTSGRKSNPAGYIFAKGDTTYSSISDDAFSMKIGEIKKIKSTTGWRILYRVQPNTDASIYNDSMKTDVLNAMKTTDLINMLDSKLKSAKVTENKHTLDKYNPKNLKDS